MLDAFGVEVSKSFSPQLPRSTFDALKASQKARKGKVVQDAGRYLDDSGMNDLDLLWHNVTRNAPKRPKRLKPPTIPKLSKAFSPGLPLKVTEVFHGTTSSAGRKILRTGKMNPTNYANSKAMSGVHVTSSHKEASNFAHAATGKVEGKIKTPKSAGKPTVVRLIALGEPIKTSGGKVDLAAQRMSYHPSQLNPVGRGPASKNEWEDTGSALRARIRAKRKGGK